MTAATPHLRTVTSTADPTAAAPSTRPAPASTGPRRPMHHLRRVVRAVALALTISVLGLLNGCETTEPARVELLDRVNESRTQAGLPRVVRNVQLEAKADAWAQKLRDRCRLSHSLLSDGAPEGWFKLGENVGFAGSIAEVHDEFLESPGHRANVMDPAFTEMGGAAVWGDCDGYHQVFVVTVYLQPR